MIRKRLAIAILAVLVSAITLLAGTSMVPAQERPSLPPGPQPMPRLPLGSPGGSGAYVISAAANEHGSFVWIVDSIQHVVTLCEKSDGGKDFTCTKKSLP